MNRCSELKNFDLGYVLDESSLIAGVDEAGRGPMAGPVVVALVIMDLKKEYQEIDDSKKLSSIQRQSAKKEILDNCIYYDIMEISSEVIDEINILEATKLGMKTLIQRAPMKISRVLIDYVKIDTNTETISIIKGDFKSLSIASASIIAKTYRDELMIKFDEQYPQYDFKSNKGYLTKKHLEALRTFGPSKIHRKTFKWS